MTTWSNILSLVAIPTTYACKPDDETSGGTTYKTVSSSVQEMGTTLQLTRNKLTLLDSAFECDNVNKVQLQTCR